MRIKADAVLSAPVASEWLQLIARRNSQACQFVGGMQLQKFSSLHPFHILEPRHEYALKKRLGVPVVEGVDHAVILFRITEPVERVLPLESCH
jgi:hypothetical protein